MIKFKCPLCALPLSTSDEAAGAELPCPGCSKPIRVPLAPRPDDVPAASVSGSPPGVAPPRESGSGRADGRPQSPDSSRPASAPAPGVRSGGGAGGPGAPASIPTPASLRTDPLSTQIIVPRENDRTLVHATIAVGLTAAFYGLLFLVKSIFHIDHGLLIKFTDRGWTCYIGVFLTLWSYSLLFQKFRTVRRRRPSLLAVYIPDGMRLETQEELEKAINSTVATTSRVGDAVLGGRIRRALQHFLTTRNFKEVGDILREESDSDQINCEASYSLVRAFLWAIPILGFIGTVVGVSMAVSEFALVLQGGTQEIGAIKAALSNVTNGLAIAFDTTFVALVLSLLVMLVMSAVEKLESAQLQEFEEYCQHNVLRRLPAAPLAKVLDDDRDQSGKLGRPILELTAAVQGWKTETAGLGTTVGLAVREAMGEASGSWAEAIKQVVVELKQATDWQKKTLDQMATERRELQATAQDLLRETAVLLREEQESIRRILTTEKEAIQADVHRHHDQIRGYTQALLAAQGRFQELVALQSRLETDLNATMGSGAVVASLAELRQTLALLEPAVARLTNESLKVEVRMVAVPTVAGAEFGNR